MADEPFGYEYWNKRLAKAESERDATPKWRWFKRSNQLEGIRVLRRIVIAEGKAEIAELNRRLGRD